MKKIQTEHAPAAIGPYSQAVRAGGAVFVSGQLPLHPETGKIAADITGQATQALANLRAVLKAAGCEMRDVVKTTIYLSDLEDFDAVNKVYADFFADIYPARAAVGVAALPKGARVEIDAIAVLANA